jgi:hypothetical protein
LGPGEAGEVGLEEMGSDASPASSSDISSKPVGFRHTGIMAGTVALAVKISLHVPKSHVPESLKYRIQRRGSMIG